MWVERPQRRELGDELGMRQLEDRLRFGDVLQAVLPHRTKTRTGREVVSDRIGPFAGEQKLAAVSGGHDPRAEVERGSEVVRAAKLNIAAMHGHPHADLSERTPVLLAQRDLRPQRGANALRR